MWQLLVRRCRCCRGIGRQVAMQAWGGMGWWWRHVCGAMRNGGSMSRRWLGWLRHGGGHDSRVPIHEWQRGHACAEDGVKRAWVLWWRGEVVHAKACGWSIQLFPCASFVIWLACVAVAGAVAALLHVLIHENRAQQVPQVLACAEPRLRTHLGLAMLC